MMAMLVIVSFFYNKALVIINNLQFLENYYDIQTFKANVHINSYCTQVGIMFFFISSLIISEVSYWVLMAQNFFNKSITK